MDDSHIIDLIQHGCKLARELEENLPNIIANQPYTNTLITHCEKIISVFTQAEEKLNTIQENISYRFDFQKWVTTTPGYADAMTKIHKGHFESSSSNVGAHTMEMLDVRPEGNPGEEVSREPPARPVQPLPVQRTRRRSGEMEKMTIKVAAPRIGNTEIPPEDGFTWRKYGQKEILGHIYPRGYFRCTHQKLYDCPAKKQVQRLDNDPTTFEVTYRGQHTCHMSSTAPSALPLQQSPPPPPLDQIFGVAPAQQPPTWFAMVARSQGSDRMAGPSTSYGKEPMEQYTMPLVVDLADQMFNSGSSSPASMDHIFPNIDDKREQGDKNDTNPN